MMAPRSSRFLLLLLFLLLLPLLPNLGVCQAVAGTATADGTWEGLAGTSPVTPGKRTCHTAIYDPAGDRMLVFGGIGAAGVFNDVWELPLSDTQSWVKVTTAGTAPPGLMGHSAIYDPVRGRMVVFGGSGNDGCNSDVWTLSLSGTPTWTQLAPAGTAPECRAFHTAIYDPVRDRMIIFAGVPGASSGNLGDVWALSLSGTPTWTEITPPCTSRFDCPFSRAYHAAIYDPAGDRMLMYAGDHDILYDPGELWALSLSGTPAWSELEGTCGLGSCISWASGAIHDPVRDRMVVFGGQAEYSLNVVNAFSLGSSQSWTELAPGGSLPPPRRFHTAVYDPRRDRMVVFGGWEWTYENSAEVSAYLDDTWALTWGEPTVPVQLALVSAEAEPGLVRLTWYAAEGNGLSATVYRRTATGEWGALGTIASDGTGQLVYEDRAVTSGTRYGYRLGVMEDGAETYLGEAWVEVPVAYGLALAGVRPNPALKELNVAFTLPDGAPARLEAYDLAGRRVAARDVGGLGAGSHVVKLGEGRALDCGVYLVRLVRAERTLTTRAVIVR